jgi:hypothetical protein
MDFRFHDHDHAVHDRRSEDLYASVDYCAPFGVALSRSNSNRPGHVFSIILTIHGTLAAANPLWAHGRNQIGKT